MNHESKRVTIFLIHAHLYSLYVEVKKMWGVSNWPGKLKSVNGDSIQWSQNFGVRNRKPLGIENRQELFESRSIALHAAAFSCWPPNVLFCFLLKLASQYKDIILRRKDPFIHAWRKARRLQNGGASATTTTSVYYPVIVVSRWEYSLTANEETNCHSN